MVKADLESVFFMEFAEEHRIAGKKVNVVLDKDKLNTLKTGNLLGVIDAEMLIMGKREDFPERMNAGGLLNVDGKEMIIVTSGEEMGMMEVALKQNRLR